jgi:hypothetical protein
MEHGETSHDRRANGVLGMLLNWIQARDEIMMGATEGLNNKCRSVISEAAHKGLN